MLEDAEIKRTEKRFPRRGHGPTIASFQVLSQGGSNTYFRVRRPGDEVGMAYKETFWMACDSTEQLRAEYGPFHTRDEAELEARKLGFGYLLRYEHIMGEDEEIQEVRCVFIELSDVLARQQQRAILHTRCATCGESSSHDEPWQAEVWADIHEFEHSRHFVRLFEHRRGTGLKEVANWRAA